MSGPITFKGKVCFTPQVTAIYPHLDTPDQFGKYSIDVDATPEMLALVEKAAADVVDAARASKDGDRYDFDNVGNSLSRKGTNKAGEDFHRISFKMKSTKTVDGKDVPVPPPQVVDAKRFPMTERVFGGSKVIIGFYIQAAVVSGKTYLSPKLAAVQVVKYVGPGGIPDAADLFEEQEGFTTSGDQAEQEAGPPYHAERGDGDQQKPAREF